MRHQQFTFVELLVIVVILLIIAAMFIPAIHVAREPARRISCASNLKQIGTTMFMPRA